MMIDLKPKTSLFVVAAPAVMMVAALSVIRMSKAQTPEPVNQPSLPRVAERMRERKPLRIVAFGDSISEVGRSPRWYGGASRPTNNWAQVLGTQLRARFPDGAIAVLNEGIGGQNSYEGLGRIDALESLRPDLVLVQFGTNDCVFHFLEPEQTQLALTTLAREIRRRFGADVMLLGTAGDNPQHPTFRHRDETIAATQQAAQDAGVAFVDMRTPVLATSANGVRWAEFHLGSDNCHPNDEGHKIWAATVLAALLTETGQR